MIPTVGKSTLLGHKYRLVGFLYNKHPLGGKNQIQILFFHQQTEAGLYLICMSEVSKTEGRLHKRVLRTKLGTIVGSEEVIPNIHRSINGATYDQFKEVIGEGFEAKACWWEQ